MKKFAILVYLIVAPAYAETVNITIPVKAENLMRSVTQVRVECRLYSARPPVWFSPTGVVATYVQKLPLDQTGKVLQVVQATLTTNENQPDPQYYQCGMQLGMTDGTWADPDPSSTIDATKARPGSAFRAREEGSIMQQLKMQQKQ